MITGSGTGFGRRLLRPFHDVLAGLEIVLSGSALRLVTVLAGVLAGWWFYVPAHELLHAAGCALAGGSVTRLEIAPLYGGRVLSSIFSFVVAGGEYAGRLSGFETHGSDWIYLATDLAPFILTLFPGVWALRRAARARHAFGFGLALPLALAPFLSLTGDAYEIGSIVITRLPPWTADLALRSDDSLAQAQTLAGAAGAREWVGFLLGQAVGIGWAALMYAAGSALARAGGQEPLPAPAR